MVLHTNLVDTILEGILWSFRMCWKLDVSQGINKPGHRWVFRRRHSAGKVPTIWASTKTESSWTGQIMEDPQSSPMVISIPPLWSFMMTGWFQVAIDWKPPYCVVSYWFWVSLGLSNRLATTTRAEFVEIGGFFDIIGIRKVKPCPIVVVGNVVSRSCGFGWCWNCQRRDKVQSFHCKTLQNSYDWWTGPEVYTQIPSN